MTDETPIVALDANALMMPVEVNIRTFEEIERLLGAVELVVPRAVLDELDRLTAGEGTEAAAAQVGRTLARDRCTEIDHAEDSADEAIVELAVSDRIDYAVTNDTPLRRRLLEAGIPVISLRGRTKLAIIQP